MSVKASAPPPLHVFSDVILGSRPGDDSPVALVPPPERYQGNLISSLESLVETTAGGVPNGTAIRSGPALVHRPESGRNYFRLTQLPIEAEIHCSTVDCDNKARLLLDSRDCEVLPYCRACAHVEFAMWMVGV